MNRLNEYLSEQLDATTGFLVTKETPIEKQIAALDDRITTMEDSAGEAAGNPGGTVFSHGDTDQQPQFPGRLPDRFL
jgi:hypothetical protein